MPARPAAVDLGSAAARSGRGTGRRLCCALGVLLLVLLGLVVPVGGGVAHAADTTRYVGTGGSDRDNDCTSPVAPCRTVQHAVDQAASGDTISIARGVYNTETAVVVDRDLTLLGHGGTVLHSGGDEETVLVNQGVTVTMSVLTVTGIGYYGVENHGTLTLDRVTVAGRPTFDGVGNYGRVTVLTSTLASGLDNYGGATVVGSTVDEFLADAGTVRFAGSTVRDCRGEPGGTADAGHNVSTDESCVTADTSKVVPDLGLLDLADNGGLTQTREPAPDSPVVNRIPAGSSATLFGVTYDLCGAGETDQRGVARPIGGGCDVGAVELDHDVPQAITFDRPDGLVYGQDDTALDATADSGLPVTIASTTPSVCTVAAGKLHVVAAGDCRLRATQPGNLDDTSGVPTFQAAAPVTVTATVARVPLTITASDAAMVDGGEAPTVTPTYTGLVNGDTAPATPPTCAVDPATEATVCSGAADPNYTITYVAGTLTVNPAPLQIVTSDLPGATVGEPYEARLHATGGADSHYTWTLAPGSALPDGLTLSDDGVISGTPSQAGTTHFTVSVNDPVTAQLSLTVGPAAATPSPTTSPGSSTSPTTSTSPGATGAGGSTDPSSPATGDSGVATPQVPAAVQTGGAPPDAGALSDTGFTPVLALVGAALLIAGAVLLLASPAGRRTAGPRTRPRAR